MAIRAAIFDLDGTLLDSTSVWQEIDEVFFARRGLAVPEGYVAAIATMNLAQAAVYTKAAYDLPESTDDIIAEWHSMAAEAYANTVPMKPGAAEYLRRCRAEGLHIALATASDPAYYRPALTRCGVLDLFDLCVHSRPGLYKGNAAFYLHCAAELGVSPEECVVFEDVLSCVRAAREAGMRVVAIADPHSVPERAEIAACADRFIEDFRELL